MPPAEVLLVAPGQVLVAQVLVQVDPVHVRVADYLAGQAVHLVAVLPVVLDQVPVVAQVLAADCQEVFLRVPAAPHRHDQGVDHPLQNRLVVGFQAVLVAARPVAARPLSPAVHLLRALLEVYQVGLGDRVRVLDHHRADLAHRQSLLVHARRLNQGSKKNLCSH